MNTYTVSRAYKLGDGYKDSHQWLAAELCYSLPLIRDHSYNSNCAKDIIPDKLASFLGFRNEKDFKIPPKGIDIPSDASKLLKSFYSSWLNTRIKEELIKRSDEHTSKRCETVNHIFQQVTNRYENIGDLDISLIEKELLTQHCMKIKNWKGPSFNKLQYRKNSTNLTVVMEYKDYRNRCMNSQEDWFKKYDGIFFARCLKEIVQILRAPLSVTDFELVAMTFAKELLFRKIQFPFAAPRLLLPAGTLFNCNDLQDELHGFHPKLNAKHIRRTSVSKRVRDYHDELLQICEYEYTVMIRNRMNINMDQSVVQQEYRESIIDNSMESYQYNESYSNYNQPYIEPHMYHYSVQHSQPQQHMTYYVQPHTAAAVTANQNMYNNDYIGSMQQQQPVDTMNDDTGSTISICTECGEQQCQCYTDNVSIVAQNSNHHRRQLQFQATNFTQIHRNVNHFNDREQRLSLHIQNMRTPQIIGNAYANR